MIKFFQNWQQKNWIQHFLHGIFYSLVVLVPTVFSTDFVSVFATPKMIIVRVLIMLAILVWGAQIFQQSVLPYRKGFLNYILIGYIAVLLITTVFSVSPWTSVWGISGQFMGFITMAHFVLLLWLLFQQNYSQKFFYNLLIVSCITATILALYGLLQFLSVSMHTNGWGGGALEWFTHWQQSFSWSQDPGERVFGTVGNATHFGIYLAIHTALSFYLSKGLKDTWEQWSLRLCALLQIIVLILTAARGPLVALLLVIAWFSLQWLIKIIKKSKKDSEKTFSSWHRTRTRTLAVILLFASGGGLIISQPSVQKYIEQLPIVERSAQGLQAFSQGKIPDRLSWWLSSLAMFRDRPLAGFGLATFRDVYNGYRRTDYQTVEAGGMEDRITPEAAHNEYLNILATEGIIGFIIFLILIAGAFYVLAEKTSHSKLEILPEDALQQSIKAGLLVYLLHLLLSFSTIATFTIFIMLLGIAYALQQPVQIRTISLLPWQRFVASGTLLCLVVGSLYLTLQEAKAELFLREAEQTAAHYDWQGTLDSLGKTINAKPTEYAYYQAFGDILMQLVKEAKQSPDIPVEQLLIVASINYEKSLALNNWHPSTYYNLGLAELQLYQLKPLDAYYQKALQNFETAIQKGVNNPLYPYQVGKALLGLSQIIQENPSSSINLQELKAKAHEDFKKAEELRPGYADVEEILARWE